MAQELRWETLAVIVADTVSASNAAAEFRNDSSQTLSIREIDGGAYMVTAAIDEHGHGEISKSPTYAAQTNNNVFFTKQWNVAAVGQAADGSSAQPARTGKYGRGQLTLEPNESLFLNVSKTSGGSFRFDVQIGYEF